MEGGKRLLAEFPATTPRGDITPYALLSSYSFSLLRGKDEKCFLIDSVAHHEDVATFPHHLHEYMPTGGRRRPRGILAFDGRFESLIGALDAHLN